jgi:hypothetical protein
MNLDAPDAWASHFLDLERDATVADLRHALGAGLTSIEHLKRYTTIGTGSDRKDIGRCHVRGRGDVAGR